MRKCYPTTRTSHFSAFPSNSFVAEKLLYFLSSPTKQMDTHKSDDWNESEWEKECAQLWEMCVERGRIHSMWWCIATLCLHSYYMCLMSPHLIDDDPSNGGDFIRRWWQQCGNVCEYIYLLGIELDELSTTAVCMQRNVNVDTQQCINNDMAEKTKITASARCEGKAHGEYLYIYFEPLRATPRFYPNFL